MFLDSFWRALDRFQCFFMIFFWSRCHGYIDTMWSSSGIFTPKLVTKHHLWSKAEVHQLRGLLQWEEQTQRLPAPALARKLSWDVMRSFSPRTFKPSWTAWGSKSPSFSDFLVASKNGLPTPTHLVLTFIDGWSAEGLRGGQSAKRKWDRVDLPKGRAWAGLRDVTLVSQVWVHSSFSFWLFCSIPLGSMVHRNYKCRMIGGQTPRPSWWLGQSTQELGGRYSSDRLSFHEVEEVYDSCSVACLRRAQTTNYSASNVLVRSLRWMVCSVRARGGVSCHCNSTS